MEYPSSESEITYTLSKVSGKAEGEEGAYRASLEHGGIDVSTDKDFLEKNLGTPYREEAIFRCRQIIKSMADAVMGDGRTRRFGDLFEIRLDIRGTFSRVDEEFDKNKHELSLSLVPLKGLKDYSRQNPPVNTQARPKGRLDKVMNEGGEIGVLKVGKEILIYGHDLTLNLGDRLRLDLVNNAGDRLTYEVIYYPEKDNIVVESDAFVRAKWFGPKDLEGFTGEATFYFNPWTRDGSRPNARGSRADIRLVGSTNG